VIQSKSKEFVFSRRKPNLTRELTAPANLSALLELDDISLSDCAIEAGHIGQWSKDSFSIDGSTLDRVNLSDTSYRSIVLTDVRLVNCDLANFETQASKLVRVEFINCRMTGFRAGRADCQHILISEGDQRYSEFRFSKFKSAEFDSCNFEEADFHGTDLTGSQFRKCNLKRAEMNEAKLFDADLSGSVVDGLKLNAEDIRGAWVDASQAMLFASLLGIRIT
jgi:uncharacterized protein YjbI with pentapeptide repeats